MGKIIGIILLIGGVLVGIIVAGLMFVYQQEGTLSGGAAFLGCTLGFFILVLPQLGFGGFFLWKGTQEAGDSDRSKKQRDLLNIVKTQGQVDIGDLVIEMGSSTDEVKGLLKDLVGMGLFSGYVNWDEGMLYSQQATKLRELHNCANCDGELELAGQGVVQCPYCGTEYFLD